MRLQKPCRCLQLGDPVSEAEYGELHSADVHLASPRGDPDGAGHPGI